VAVIGTAGLAALRRPVAFLRELLREKLARTEWRQLPSHVALSLSRLPRWGGEADATMTFWPKFYAGCTRR
jgi:hypothetical protein